MLVLFISGGFILGGPPFLTDQQGLVWAESDKNDEEIEETEEEIDDLQDELEDAKDEKEKHEVAKQQIASEVASLNNSILSVETKIRATEGEIEKLEQEIQRTKESLEEKKRMLAEAIRVINQVEREISLMVLAKGGNLSEYFSILDDLEQVQERVLRLADSVRAEKKVFEGKKSQQEAAYASQEKQKNELKSEKSKKAYLLSKTKEKINQQEVTISQLEAKVSKLKTELSSLLGDSYDAEDIEDAAKYASKVTGTRKDFIMGMLVVESDLGRYTGGCTYEEVEDGAKDAYKDGRLSQRSYNTFKRRRETFKDICEDLDYDYEDQKVSCNPSSYAGTGGAMGVAQFMPDTWMGYQSSIASVTGHNPPDPWNLTDGVVAMGLKLAKVPGVSSHKRSAECDAAKLYLSGTTSSHYQWYCDKVLYWADNYDNLLD